MATQTGMSIREILHGRPSLLEKTSAIRTPVESNLSQDLNTIIKEAASTYRLDEELIHSVIKHESNYKQYNVSHAEAQEYMQLKHGTDRETGVTDPLEDSQQIC